MECIWGRRTPHKKGQAWFPEGEGGATGSQKTRCLLVLFLHIPEGLPQI